MKLRLVAAACVAVLAVAPPALADDWTDLRAAIYYKQSAEVVALLDRGVDVNIQNEEGWTPLMIAAEQGDVKMVRYLLSRGADPNIRNGRGRTAWDVTTSSEIKALLKGVMAPIRDPLAPRAAPAAAPAAKTKAKAPAPQSSKPAASNHCKTMYGKTYKLCDTSDYSCKIKANTDYQACLKRGTWY